jgi:hypothetical protein
MVRSQWQRCRYLLGVLPLVLLGLSGRVGDASNSFVIDAQGTLPAACDLSTTSPTIALAPTADLRSLQGSTTFNLASTGDYTLGISSLTVTRPTGYSDYQATVAVSQGPLQVANSSEAAAVTSSTQPGPASQGNLPVQVRVAGRDGTLLKAGLYRVQATLICTAQG